MRLFEIFFAAHGFVKFAWTIKTVHFFHQKAFIVAIKAIKPNLIIFFIIVNFNVFV